MIQLNIHAENATDLRNELASILAQPTPLAPLPSSGLIPPAEFGADLQGGFYAGPHFEGGKLVHLIGAPEALGDRKWEDAKTVASEYRGGGFDDWFLPDVDQLTIGRIYAKAKFDKTYHWSATPCGSDDAWNVNFEGGGVYLGNRNYEFRVRPFRRLSI